VSWRNAPSHGGTTRRFEGRNPPAPALIDYALAKKGAKVSLKVVDVNGAIVSEPRASGDLGLHRIPWNLARGAGPAAGRRIGAGPGQRRSVGAGEGPPTAAAAATIAAAPTAAGSAAAGTESESAAPPVPERRFGRALAVSPGLYRVVLTVDGKEFSQTIRVEPDPNGPMIELADDDDEMNDEDEPEAMTEEGEEEEGPAKPIIR
jgi:hypothetical protein